MTYPRPQLRLLFLLAGILLVGLGVREWRARPFLLSLARALRRAGSPRRGPRRQRHHGWPSRDGCARPPPSPSP